MKDQYKVMRPLFDSVTLQTGAGTEKYNSMR